VENDRLGELSSNPVFIFIFTKSIYANQIYPKNFKIANTLKFSKQYKDLKFLEKNSDLSFSECDRIFRETWRNFKEGTPLYSHPKDC
jgi:hypothetical protein